MFFPYTLYKYSRNARPGQIHGQSAKRKALKYQKKAAMMRMTVKSEKRSVSLEGSSKTENDEI